MNIQPFKLSQIKKLYTASCPTNFICRSYDIRGRETNLHLSPIGTSVKLPNVTKPTFKLVIKGCILCGFES